MERTERTDGIVRRHRGRAALASLATAALMTAAATACGGPFQDLGPLPPRFSGPPLPADAVVSEMMSVLAAEGITVARQPPDGLGRCTERLTGRHAPGTVDSALEAAVERARSEHGWQPGPDLGSGALTLTKGNWTALTALPSPDPGQGVDSLVILSLSCVDGGTPTATATSAPAPTPS
ncbi:hypothetical protein [Streptomyces erythrochromogenes]|uniref:hypothetical protein n=1 Tax=Streptomyces erythrochromogenes TaxID=285574 RepID=UPI00369C4B68